MAFDDEPRRDPPPRIATSQPLELLWLVFCCSRGPTGVPREVVEAADSFWADGLGVDAELLIVADRLGCLTDAPLDPLLGLEDVAIGRLPADLDLRTEDEPLRAAIPERLERLRGDRKLRRRYSRLLRGIWSSVEAEWTGIGAASAERAGRRMRASLEHGLAPIELLPAHHIARRDGYDGLTRQALADGRLLLVPSHFAGERGLILALPGVLLVSLGTGVGSDVAQRRTEVERVSRGLKLLSDATRLLILTELDRKPATVGDIARRVAVAQPTASVHVKQLREAGLIAADRVAGDGLYRVRQDRVRELLRAAHEMTLGGS